MSGLPGDTLPHPSGTVIQQFTPNGQRFIQNFSQRYGISTDAVIAIIFAVMNGNGTMAQFSQYGTIGVISLPLVSGGGYAPQPQQNFIAPVQQNFTPPPVNAAYSAP